MLGLKPRPPKEKAVSASCSTRELQDDSEPALDQFPNRSRFSYCCDFGG